jgi:Holliday junction resolvase RusA-like endonuclease
MSGPLTITVHGRPAPQGSKRAFVIRGGPRKGQAAVIESSHDRVKSWRQAVVDAACAVKTFPALEGPLALAMVFYLPRPKDHYRTGRNAHLLRDSAPAYPAGTPDLGKLARSTEDALTCALIWRDDAQVVSYAPLAKVYADDHHLLGAIITIRQIGNTDD